MTVTEAVKKMIGENEMSMVLEILKAEGVAEGIAKGKVLAILEVKFNKVPQEIEKAIRSMVDLIALESLVEHAKTCESLDEFGKALG